MSFGKCVFVALICLFSSVALSQSTFYHCVKNGQKLISDQPCENFGAEESKRVRASEMPPLNTTQGLTKNERQRGQAVSNRLRIEEQQHRNKQEYQKSKAEKEKKIIEKQCADLWRYKEQIVASQRRGNSDYWNAEHRQVNDKIYRLNCGS